MSRDRKARKPSYKKPGSKPGFFILRMMLVRLVATPRSWIAASGYDL
jgi:hypothetical protein